MVPPLGMLLHDEEVAACSFGERTLETNLLIEGSCKVWSSLTCEGFGGSVTSIGISSYPMSWASIFGVDFSTVSNELIDLVV